MDAEGLVVDAFAQLGIDARSLGGATEQGTDLVLDPDGVATRVQVKRRSLVTDDVANRLLAERAPTDDPLIVVADRVTMSARKALTSQRAGYLDLRGRLALHTGHLVIDAEVEPVHTRAERSQALNSKGALEVATALLLRSGRPVAVRELARELGRSPSTVSEVLALLRRVGSIDARNAVESTDLFWRLAEHWHSPRTHLAKLPASRDRTLTRALRLGLDNVAHTPGWALTDSAAAIAFGLVRYRRATSLLGAAPSPLQAAATIRAAPVPAVVQQRVDLHDKAVRWPLVHPLFVALDLAQDVGRGREILKAWTPDDRWTRVW